MGMKTSEMKAGCWVNLGEDFALRQPFLLKLFRSLQRSNAMATKLGGAAIEQRLGELNGWAQTGDEIRKTFQLASFPAAIAFVAHVGFLAEAAGHHPDIDIRWRNVTLALTTHDAGGLTANDFDLAAKIDAITN
jgi:4a-hydroxytetrahydrobiopterin dehydratase